MNIKNKLSFLNKKLSELDNKLNPVMYKVLYLNEQGYNYEGKIFKSIDEFKAEFPKYEVLVIEFVKPEEKNKLNI